MYMHLMEIKKINGHQTQLQTFIMSAFNGHACYENEMLH